MKRILNLRILAVFLLFFVFSGCAKKSFYSMKAEEEWNKLVEASAIRNICVGKQDCKLKWERAIKWLETYSGWNIEILNNEYLKTYGPSPESLDIAYAVQKIPLVKTDEYEINFIVRCGTVPDCNEKSLRATANFKYFLENGKGLETNEKSYF